MRLDNYSPPAIAGGHCQHGIDWRFSHGDEGDDGFAGQPGVVTQTGELVHFRGRSRVPGSSADKDQARDFGRESDLALEYFQASLARQFHHCRMTTQVLGERHSNRRSWQAGNSGGHGLRDVTLGMAGGKQQQRDDGNRLRAPLRQPGYPRRDIRLREFQKSRFDGQRRNSLGQLAGQSQELPRTDLARSAMTDEQDAGGWVWLSHNNSYYIGGQSSGGTRTSLHWTQTVYSYLLMTGGARVGTHFVLDADRQNHLGRGLDCDVILCDPLSSRVHAIILCENGDWWVRDAGSRNGSFVNGQKIDEARLTPGATLKIGSSEFEFRQAATRPNDTSRLDHTQSLLRDRRVEDSEPGHFGLEALQDNERAHDFLTLHQLSLRLLGCSDPDEVVQFSLELLRERTRASVVGFLWASDDGQLKPKLVIPEDAAGKVQLSGDLTEMVIRQGRAIWIDNQREESGTANLQHFADAICVPLVQQGKTLGALHVYLEKGGFRQGDFEIAIALANILTVALARARRETMLQFDHRRLAEKAAVFDELVGDSKPMQDLKSRITRIARATGCVLVRGESGSGKELVARAVHRASARSDRPMLSINCAAIPRDLMESQLFGHKKGSFTGADADHSGLFQQAHTGTLFLDEVGEMTLDGQAKLLRILEGHPFLPVGSTKEVTADVRVIAATNRDLRDFVREGRFREDLYYRLSVFELYIPPLRERGADIELLMDHFLEHFKRQHGRPNLALAPDARDKLLGYAWPGNVRQLRNVIDSATVMSEGSLILEGDLGLRDASSGDQLESLRMDFWERKLIQEALKRTGDNVPEAARLLGLGRATLYRKIEEHGIERK